MGALGHFLERQGISHRLAIADKISIREDAEINRDYPGKFRCHVDITTRDGATRSTGVDYPHGHHLDPMSDAEVEAKFRELAGRKLPVMSDGQVAQDERSQRHALQTLHFVPELSQQPADFPVLAFLQLQLEHGTAAARAHEARVSDLEPTDTLRLAGRWQIAFLGETEPRAARPGRDAGE